MVIKLMHSTIDGENGTMNLISQGLCSTLRSNSAPRLQSSTFVLSVVHEIWWFFLKQTFLCRRDLTVPDRLAPGDPTQSPKITCSLIFSDNFMVHKLTFGSPQPSGRNASIALQLTS